MNFFTRFIMLISFGFLLQNSPAFSLPSLKDLFKGKDTITCKGKPLPICKAPSTEDPFFCGISEEDLYYCSSDELQKLKLPALNKANLVAEINKIDLFPHIKKGEGNVFNGNIPMPKITTILRVRTPEEKEKGISPVIRDKMGKPVDNPNFIGALKVRKINSLKWTKAVAAVTMFRDTFASDSDSLTKALREIFTARYVIQKFLDLVNLKQDRGPGYKIVYFLEPTLVLPQLRKSLQMEVETVKGVRMFLGDTRATREVILATIQKMVDVIDRIVDDYRILERDYEASLKDRQEKAVKEQALIEQEKEKIMREGLAAKATFEVAGNAGEIDFGGWVPPKKRPLEGNQEKLTLERLSRLNQLTEKAELTSDEKMELAKLKKELGVE